MRRSAPPASCRPYHEVAAWLAVLALLSTAFAALSVAPEDARPGTSAKCSEQELADTVQSDIGLPPASLVPGQWTWVSGSNGINQLGKYGPLGMPAAMNVPGARVPSVSWTDEIGNLWLFGGDGYYSATSFDLLNDLWRYSVASGQWIWMSGSKGIRQGGTYGTIGKPAATNVPGARSGSVSWTDGSGNLWLFGGYGYSASVFGDLNDLWRYSIASGQWTWMSGSNGVNQIGTYGTLGTPAATNVPGAREGSVSWTDRSGNLWLFGGFGYSASVFDDLNDLWRYSIASGLWTWMSGSNGANQVGTYGTLGTPAATNVPGARNYFVSWTDGSGNLWLFGGAGYAETGPAGLNDLWKYNIASGQWTWMSGSNDVNQVGTYGTLGTPAAANVPGARSSSVSWTDWGGNLWLFGGGGFSHAHNLYGDLNDLWVFSIPQGRKIAFPPDEQPVPHRR